MPCLDSVVRRPVTAIAVTEVPSYSEHVLLKLSSVTHTARLEKLESQGYAKAASLGRLAQNPKITGNVPLAYVLEQTDVEKLRDPVAMKHREFSSIDLFLDEAFDRSQKLIARMACQGEDSATSSQAGQSLSIPGIRSRNELANAFRKILFFAQRDESAASKSTLNYVVIVQHEVVRQHLVVASAVPEHPLYVEVHNSQGDVLADGASPDMRGPVELWTDVAVSLRADVTSACQQAAELIAAPLGLDIELVVDPDDKVWLVQARPLVAPLFPEWQSFRHLAESSADWSGIRNSGRLVLDAEHNPKPLSPAHTWLIREMATRRPSSGKPRVLAGWLYMQTLPGGLGTQGKFEANLHQPHNALRRLITLHLPRARQDYEAFRRRLPTTTTDYFDEALALFFDMLDIYLGELVVTRAHTKRRPYSELATNKLQRFTLANRVDYLDVLPVEWDVASPPIRFAQGQEHTHFPPPISLKDERLSLNEVLNFVATDEQLALAVLCEWDDHLFALGMAPVRAAFLESARRLELSLDDVFYLNSGEIRSALGDRTKATDELLSQTIEKRRRVHKQYASTTPPLQLHNGWPVPGGSNNKPLNGIPVGEDFKGNISVRTGLDDLLARPPSPSSIVCLPSLTAQASTVLAQLQIKAVCTEHGGALSHGVLMARELGLAALIGCSGCTTVPDGIRALLSVKLGKLVVIDAS